MRLKHNRCIYRLLCFYSLSMRRYYTGMSAITTKNDNQLRQLHKRQRMAKDDLIFFLHHSMWHIQWLQESHGSRLFLLQPMTRHIRVVIEGTSSSEMQCCKMRFRGTWTYTLSKLTLLKLPNWFLFRIECCWTHTDFCWNDQPLHRKKNV